MGEPWSRGATRTDSLSFTSTLTGRVWRASGFRSVPDPPLPTVSSTLRFRRDMEPEEAYDLARRAIYHATHRDAYSGGQVNLYHVQEEGWVKISADIVFDLHYAYEAERKEEEPSE